MKKFKNTFIPGVILIIVTLIAFQVIQSFSYKKIDTNSYIELIRGSGELNKKSLTQEYPQKIITGDVIKTQDQSLAVIQWGDGSLTRIGENSEIKIQLNNISSDRSLIDISFHLISGKTWSHIISFISDESSFTQSFDDVEAGVRGTVFDVDLTRNFLRVSDHEVSLTPTIGDTITLSEGEIINTQSLSFIKISEFLASLEDKAWTEINTQFDTEYIEELTQNLHDSLEIQNPFLFILEYFSLKYRLFYDLDTAENFEQVQKQLDKLDKKKHSTIYKAVFARYQKLNFVEANSYEFYKRKIFYKKALVFLSKSDTQKEQFLRTSVYDLRDILQSQESVGLGETLEFLMENKDILQDLDFSFLQTSFDFIPVGLRESFEENFNELKDILPDLEDMNFENIGDTSKNLLDAADTGIKDFLDDTAGGLLDSFKK